MDRISLLPIHKHHKEFKEIHSLGVQRLLVTVINKIKAFAIQLVQIMKYLLMKETYFTVHGKDRIMKELLDSSQILMINIHLIQI
jgi:hypothetical protein